MKLNGTTRARVVLLFVSVAVVGCTGARKNEEERLADFLGQYLPEAKRLEREVSSAYWEAYTTGADDAYAAAEKAELAHGKFHSDSNKFHEIREIRAAGTITEPLMARQVDLIYTDFAENQIPTELMEKMVALSTAVSKEFNVHRARVGEREYDRNAVKDVLRGSTDNSLREAVWTSHKSIGGKIAAQVLELVGLRNEAARELGYESFWHMSMEFQEHDPEKVTASFTELDSQTREPYAAAKAEMDRVLSARLGVEPGDLKPWHYADPFVQEAPLTTEFDLDTLYEKIDLLALSSAYFKSFGLDPTAILEKSDVHPRPGKSNHAFCFNLDRENQDVRVLLNLKPTDQWMDTTLHELGHGVYEIFFAESIPWRLREPAHILTTEGVAQLFGEMTKNPHWIRANLTVDEAAMPKIIEAARDSRVLQQLIFARWSLVMFHFEKALYTGPGQDLNSLWWSLVEKYQMVSRPAGRDEPDWATKDHVVVAPVYYHNYVLGQMFKAQLLEAIAAHTGKKDPLEVIFNGDREAGQFLIEKVFRPGASRHFLELTEEITGEAFSARAYGESFAWGEGVE